MDSPVVRSLTGRAPTAAAGRSAVLFTHDLSVPDREVTAALLLRGRGSANGRLAIDSREGSRVLPGPPSLLQRLRNQARASRDCRRQLSRADVAGGDYP
jgi:hypothetical protein